jgi:threonine dehydrogenase-like Zn-dependent dehydrogenase
MKAVVFHFSVPRYAVGKALGGITSSVTLGALSGLKLQDVPPPVIPRGDWARLRVLYAGICGTDTSTLLLHTSPLLEPFGSFPAVLGHEILAEVVEVGPEVDRVEVGDRVVVEPMISCETRGYELEEACPSCRAGYPSTCGKAGEEGPLTLPGGGNLAPGLTVGYHKDLYGAWGEELVAHQNQLFKVPEEMDDKMAVLVEPLSIGLHAVLNSPPGPEETVLVVGSGPIAMGTVWALRASGFTGELVVQAKRAGEMEFAMELGATRVVRPGPEARQEMIDTGAHAYLPIVGPEVYGDGGFPVIYDCVGSQESLSQALRFASARGRIVLLGCASQLKKLDLTFLWARELRVTGYVGYGSEVWGGRNVHTFDVAMELLQRGFPLERMVTHIFPLSQFRDALRAAVNRRRSGAMKVLLKPGA